MFGKFYWDKLKVNRWSFLIFALLMIAGLQGCGPGDCLRTIFVNMTVFVVFAIILSFLFGWIPYLGPILVIVILWNLFVSASWHGGKYSPGIKQSCGCSAFCNTVKPEIANQELTEPHPFKGGEDELEN